MARLNPKHLESFQEIVRTGSVTDAARNLGLTQSAVSRQLAQLEKHLGLELFHRDRGRLVQLPEAKELAREVELAITSLDRIERLAADFRTLSTGRLRIAGPPSLMGGPLAKVIATFLDEHPNVRFSLDSRSRETVIELALNKNVDFGFVKLPLTHQGVNIDPIVRSRTVCAVRKGHPLERKAHLTPRDLDGQPLILLGKGREFQQQIRTAFRDTGAKLRISAETHAVGASCALAAQGVGVAIVNELMAESYLELGISLVPFEPDIPHAYAIVWSAQMPLSQVMQAFLEHCRLFFSASRPDANSE